MCNLLKKVLAKEDHFWENAKMIYGQEYFFVTSIYFMASIEFKIIFLPDCYHCSSTLHCTVAIYFGFPSQGCSSIILSLFKQIPPSFRHACQFSRPVLCRVLWTQVFFDRLKLTTLLSWLLWELNLKVAKLFNLCGTID